MNLNGRPAIDARWQSSAGKPLSGFLNCTIDLLDMKLKDDGTDYNWFTNTGGTSVPETLASGVDAQLQVFRFVLTMDAPVGSVNQVRSVRFTVNAEDIDGIDIREGQVVRVTACEKNPSLERYQYVVNSGLNSPWAFRPAIETEVDMARVVTWQ